MELIDAISPHFSVQKKLHFLFSILFLDYFVFMLLLYVANLKIKNLPPVILNNWPKKLTVDKLF